MKSERYNIEQDKIIKDGKKWESMKLFKKMKGSIIA